MAAVKEELGGRSFRQFQLQRMGTREKRSSLISQVYSACGRNTHKTTMLSTNGGPGPKVTVSMANLVTRRARFSANSTNQNTRQEIPTPEDASL